MSLAASPMGVNAGARLDRLPMSRWHYKLIALVTAGVFVDLFELYSGGSILAALVQSGWSTMSINATFLSVTFLGLLIGAWCAGGSG
jgi:putative MFS transporter